MAKTILTLIKQTILFGAVLLFFIKPIVAADYPPKNEDIIVPGFLDSFKNLPEDWMLFKNDLVDPKNRSAFWNVMAWTAVTVATDYESWQYFKDMHDDSRSMQVMNFHFVSAGDGFFQFSLAGVFGAYGAVADDHLALRTAQQITEVILATGAVVQLMKHVTGREAPLRTSTRTGNWVPFPEQGIYHRNVQKYDAVPSGHLATAYATFLIIWDNYNHVPWIPWVGYPITGLIAVGLVGTSLHWISDYPIGLALGQMFANVITRRNHKKKPQASLLTPQFIPIISSNSTPMMGLKWIW